jgi:probable F420-dependent oxidoreductase
MRIGVVIPNTGPGTISSVRELPAEVEAAGFDSLWFSDHVVGVPQFEKPAVDLRESWAEIVVSMTWAAATTNRIRIGAGVLVAPYRSPVLVAKQLATLDALSGGRTVVGLGVGWSRAEYTALGVGELFSRRGAVTTDVARLLRACWMVGTLSWSGPAADFDSVAFEPSPHATGGPPIWIGGHSSAALRRAAEVADTWHPFGLTAERVQELGTRLDVLAGRPVPRVARLKLPAGVMVKDWVAELGAYAEAGCTELVIDLAAEVTAEVRTLLADFADAIDGTGLREAGAR